MYETDDDYSDEITAYRDEMTAEEWEEAERVEQEMSFIRPLAVKVQSEAAE